MTEAVKQQGKLNVYYLRGEPGNFTEIFKAEARPTGTTELPGDTYGTTSIGGIKVANRVQNPLKWWEYYLHSVVHQGCCDVKAEDTAGGGFTMEGIDGKAISSTLEAEIAAMVERSTEALVDAVRDYEVTGWLALECEPAMNSRELYQLNQIDSHTMWAATDRTEGYVHKVGNRAVRFMPLGYFDQKWRQMAWLNNKHWFKSNYYGVPDVVSALIQVDTAWEALKYNREFFARRGGYRWMLMLSSTGPEQDDSADANLITEINYHINKVGKESTTDMLMIPLGDRTAQLMKLDADAKDLDFPGLLKSVRDDLLINHKVPPIKIGIVETGQLGGDNANQQLRVYRDGVIAPRQRRLNQLISRIIKAWYGVDVRFKFTPVEIDEFALLTPHVVNLWREQGINRREMRDMLGMGDVDNGVDVWYDEVNPAPEPPPQFQQPGGGADAPPPQA